MDRFSPNDRYLGSYIIDQTFCDCSRDFSVAANFRGKIGLHTFICRSGILKWIGISQFRFQRIQWQWFLYIVYKFGEIWSSNPRVYEDHQCTPSSISSGVILQLHSLGGAPLRTATISSQFCRVISTQFCFTTICKGATLLCHAGDTIGSSTHF